MKFRYVLAGLEIITRTVPSLGPAVTWTYRRQTVEVVRGPQTAIWEVCVVRILVDIPFPPGLCQSVLKLALMGLRPAAATSGRRSVFHAVSLLFCLSGSLLEHFAGFSELGEHVFAFGFRAPARVTLGLPGDVVDPADEVLGVLF